MGEDLTPRRWREAAPPGSPRRGLRRLRASEESEKRWT
ncbi:unnamed protein product [Spirodela intermedia]|uniref:Uncharacterized protein n=1 Tax=Spirodela intermedia TaxID=51605 RepID=A0A7I8IKI4_SPIIN|nr:unnamed protein product [Spirodela intermedia]CAA6657903.1 unnamed protein product [Spirodela intermedia]